jgi:hypothetical protein
LEIVIKLPPVVEDLCTVVIQYLQTAVTTTTTPATAVTTRNNNRKNTVLDADEELEYLINLDPGIIAASDDCNENPYYSFCPTVRSFEEDSEEECAAEEVPTDPPPLTTTMEVMMVCYQIVLLV